VILFDSGRQADTSLAGKMWDRQGFVFVTFFIKTLIITQNQLDYDDWEHV